MSSKGWSIGLQNHTKMTPQHVPIRPTDKFKQVGVREKNMTEMRSIVWMTTRLVVHSRNILLIDLKSF